LFSGNGDIEKLTCELVEAFISEVKVFSAEKIEIIFNFADEYATLYYRIHQFL